MTDRMCSVDGCAKPARNRGWCRGHYKRWQTHGDPLAGRASPSKGVTCSIEGCEKGAKSRGWCAAHYGRWLRHGDPLAEDLRPKRGACLFEECEKLARGRGYCATHYKRLVVHGDAAHGRTGFHERLLAGIERRGPNECWLWSGGVTGGGYGRTGRTGVLTHRAAYELFLSPIPDGLTVDHLCHKHDECEGGDGDPHRRCCNPAHLGLAPIVENAMRGNSPSAKNARKTHCVHDHLFDEANTGYDGNGDRYCKACACDRQRRYQQRKRRQAT